MFKRLLTLLTALLLLQAVPLSAQSIVTGEYFWDTDPGQGNGTVVTAVDGAFNQSIEQVLATIATLPSAGSHVFHVRVKDADNHWGPVFKTAVQILPSIVTTRAIKVTAAETFWDTDPGQGNGTVMLAFDGNFSDAIEAVVNAILPIPSTVAVHTLHIRVRDAANTWSPIFRVNVDVQPAIATTRTIKVTAGEYFWDTDPGQGNGTTILAFDGNYDQATEVIAKDITMNSISVGQHVLSLRVKDAANAWSPLFSTVVDVQNTITSVRAIRISAAECFFDTDPGHGNGTAMLAFDGNFNAALETIRGNVIPSPVLQGYHTLYMRAKDVAGGWGPSFGVVVNMDTSINTFATAVNGTTEFCTPVSNPQTYTTPATAGNTYSWSVLGGSIVTGQGSNSIQVIWNGIGYHSITVIECNNGQSLCDTAQQDVWIYTPQTANISAGICQGDSLQFGAQWLKNAGQYSRNLTTVHGCDSTINLTLSVYSSYAINANATIAIGDSIYLAGAWQKVSGTYVDHFSTSHGCDSTVTTVLVVNFVSSITGPTSLCQAAASNILYTAALHSGSSYNWQVTGGNIVGSAGINSIRVTWTTGGTNNVTLIECNSNATFCDTLVYNVVVSNGILQQHFESLCQGDSVFAQGAWQHNAGNYFDTIPTGTGCDTVIVTNVSVYPNYAGSTNVVIAPGDSAYCGGAWQHNTGVFVDHYQTVHGCDSAVTTFLLVVIGLEEINSVKVIATPNPANEEFGISYLPAGNWQADLYASDGKLLWSKQDFTSTSRVNTAHYPTGMYVFRLRSDQGTAHVKVQVMH